MNKAWRERYLMNRLEKREEFEIGKQIRQQNGGRKKLKIRNA